MIVAATGWPDVALALIAATPGLVAAVLAYMNRQHLKTPSGTPIGKQVESTHHVSLGNNYRLRSLTGELNVAAPEAARREERATEYLEPDGDDTP